MCGIAGYFGLPKKDEALLRRMGDAQIHRGPDGEGLFVHGTCGLSHRRLAIIDREHGAQPFISADGNLALSYNGEIYNYLQLRAELEAAGRQFVTDSDTEVVLQSFAQWGEKCFDRFNGMFALAIYDRAAGRLTLARDHFGIKPLYFTEPAAGQLLFASEIKALLATGLVTARPNDRQIYRYLKFRAHEDLPDTFFDGIYKLMPGELMVAETAGIRRRFYSDLPEQLAAAAKQQLPYTPVATEQYREALTGAVRRRLVGEVPVGTCLSGGLDSSVIALTINQLLNAGDQAAEQVGDKQNTFSAIFPGSANDEERYIDAVLAKAGDRITSHKIKPTADDFAADLTDFIRTQEEPTISTGPYAQYKVMQLAHDYVTVLLDGQGADEIMAGYYPYYFVWLRQLARQRRWLKLAAEATLASGVLWRALRFKVYDLVKFRRRVGIGELLAASFMTAYGAERFPVVGDDLRRRFIQDTFYNSLPALLRYEDKNTMRFSLEGRIPFLDKEVLPELFSLSDSAIIRGSWNKRILRDAARGLLPELVRARRNKIGFTTPEGEWFLRLKTRFYGVFLSESFAGRPYFNQPAILKAFEDFIAGRNNTDSMMFWRLLNVELWLREFCDEKAAAESRPARRPLEANPDRQLDLTAAAGSWRRYPISTPMVKAGDDVIAMAAASAATLFEQLSQAPADHRQFLTKPWRLFVSEKIVAIAQGRSYFIWDIKPGFWARFLQRFVVRTPYGIGLGSPWTMQLAIDEAGATRIIAAAIAGAIGKVFGRRGLFYELAGANVRAIDGPTEYSVYPSNVSAKLPPKDPAKVAAAISAAVRAQLPAEIVANFGGTVIIDANDLGRNVLGDDTGRPAAELEAAFADNPLGQAGECTPMAVVFEAKQSD